MPNFVFPDLPLDGLLRRAAVRDPDGIAVRTTDTALGFGELDLLTDRLASWLRRQNGGRSGVRTGVAHVLDPVFAATYYGTVRSGATAVLVNPLMGEDGLRHVFATAGVEVAFVPAATAELLTKLRGVLPRLRTIVVTDAPDGVTPGDTLSLHLELESAPHTRGHSPCDPGSIACIQFTTGSTGPPKGVLLTHRNMVANAKQTALAHRLDPASVTLNHLPLYHVMHLNSAVYAGACQVLCQDPDPFASLASAASAGATHYYGLPARLHRLAVDERLAAASGPPPGGARLTAVLSGGSGLRPEAARALRDRLGVPVIQGYGMAETSPLTHCQRPGRYRTGEVGGTVPGTECRLVDVDTRTPVEVWSTGEVQVKGPQLMAGYLTDAQPSRIDEDGWFSTGDVGYLDDDGELRLVDRLDDIFKYDNEIVSPSRIERVIGEDPRVADCIVVDWPDAVHGGLVWAGIVLRENPGGAYAGAAPGPGGSGRAPGADVLASVIERANERLADFERIRLTEALDAVPRTPTGKPERRALRQRLKNRTAA
ncbi:long-chain fatty acid--CoA ligase [Streptomyces sp. A0642]|uniref:class I adenylate-forming enzyme family protein n=1 Tax=Streptomyces sp. A0642 TaxID=2563100 RepID=UPI0010A237A7|nr:class I adenylate-forming enzyme family protein [Streptomyces sp. A0642]THA64131.1 long-chain fatty acid--CoA ligase [Streptomyces sp. A0642]